MYCSVKLCVLICVVNLYMLVSCVVLWGRIFVISVFVRESRETYFLITRKVYGLMFITNLVNHFFDYPPSATAGICLAIMVGLITFVLFISASVGMRLPLYRGTWRRLY